MSEAQRSSAGAWRTYLELATGLGEVSRKQVRKVVKDLVGKGNATADQLRAMSGELLAVNTVNREALGKLVKIEVDRALGRVGLATMDEVNELTARVRDLERQLREARAAETAPATQRTAATTAPTRRGPRPAKKAASTTAKVMPAKATTAKGTTAKATKATTAESATSPAVRKAARKAAKAPTKVATTATRARVTRAAGQ
jgi:polyhydroxyalkanoate synthesis regulator phasin